MTAANEYHIVIDFDAHGPRRFATPLVRLEPALTPAPEKRAAPRRRVARRS
ncbi:MAG TPA: hypothetical protein VNI78_05645 [Vicinamibacterales bacterium]|nr:hypothetical protein [Vicinamibacterales bacterium]